MRTEWEKSWSRRTVFKALGAGVVTSMVGLPARAASASSRAPIVQAGAPAAAVVLPDQPDSQTVSAADRLIDYLARSTGATLPTASDSALDDPAHPFHGATRIYVGMVGERSDPSTAGQLAGLDGDGFALVPAADSLTIIGPTPWGTRHGVLEFLERCVGVRWLLPGPDGDDVPAHSDLSAPTEVIRSQPVSRSRNLAPLHNQGNNVNHPDWDSTDPGTAWAMNNRLHYRWGAEHNLFNVYSAALYADPTLPTYHPEYYPILNGQTYLPKPGQYGGWQPRFTAPGAVDAAIDYVVRYFAKDPSRESVPLGVNDSGAFSEDEMDLTDLNSVGSVNMSPVYYQWLADVVNGAIAAHPEFADKWFGAIAYAWVLDPPPFALPPQALVLPARDRGGLFDPANADLYEDITTQWQQTGCTIGWRGYTYGSPYAAPRVMISGMAAALRNDAEHGVVAQYLETDPNWGEGPKYWAYAKLLWDPTLDPDDLVDEWCERVVGRRAAASLRAYFKRWECIWETRVTGTGWFSLGLSRSYFPFTHAGYLNVITDEDLTGLRSLLEQAAARTATSAQAARLQLLTRMFDYYEASAASYPRPVSTPTDEQSALTLLDFAAAPPLDAVAQRAAVYAALQQDPLLKEILKGTTHYLNWSGWNGPAFWSLIDYVGANEVSGGAVTQAIADFAAGADANGRRLAGLLQAVLGGAASLTVNPSFEDAVDGGAHAAGWSMSVAGGGGFTRHTELSRTGQASLRATHTNEAILEQTITLESGLDVAAPGLLAARLWYRCPDGGVPAIQHTGNISLIYMALDGSGALLREASGNAPIVAEAVTSPDAWSSLGFLEDIPRQAQGKTVAAVKLRVLLDNFMHGNGLYVDDFVAYQLPTPWRTDVVDTFDGDTPGDAPSGWTVTDPGGSWTVQPEVDHGNVLVVSHDVAGSAPAATWDFGATAGPVRLSFQVRTDEVSFFQGGFVMTVTDSGGAEVMGVHMSAQIFKYTDGGVTTTTSVNYGYGDWHTVDAVIEPTGVYTFYIDRTEIASAACTPGGGAPSAFRVNFGPNTPAGRSCALDNIAVMVPDAG
jgi:hypothetical protein